MNSWFKLPWVSRETYVDLMKAKVKHDSRMGFCLTAETNVPRALTLLSSALDEQVELARSCFICDKPLEESDSEVTIRSICKDCQSGSDSYDIYVMKFAKLMENA